MHTTWVHYSVLLTDPLAHLDPFKTDCQPTHFLCQESILKQVLDTPHVVYILVTVSHAFPLCGVHMLARRFFPLRPPPAVLLFRSGFVPEIFCGTLTPLPSLPPILLQSRHPHQHVSGAVWVSINVTSNTYVSRLECPLTTPPLIPSLLTHLPPKVLHCMLPACLPACLPDPLAEMAPKKTSPTVSSPSPSSPLLKHPTSIQLLIPAVAVKNHPTAA